MFPSDGKGKVLPDPCYTIDDIIDIPDNDIIIKDNIFNHYSPNLNKILAREFQIERTYEKPFYTYYLVLQPLKCRYEKDSGSYQEDILKIEKCLRNRYNYNRVLITREIKATQTHYNVIITTSLDIIYNKKVWNNRYGIYNEVLQGIEDIKRVFRYILKESIDRSFQKNLDYFVYCK